MSYRIYITVEDEDDARSDPLRAVWSLHPEYPEEQQAVDTAQGIVDMLTVLGISSEALDVDPDDE